MIEVGEPGFANGFRNGCIGLVEVLRHGRQYVLDPSVPARVYLLTTDENDLRACNLRATNVTSGDDNFLQIADVLSLGPRRFGSLGLREGQTGVVHEEPEARSSPARCDFSHRPRRSCSARSGWKATPRSQAVSSQRFKFAALRIDVPPDVRFDGLEPRVIVQRQPHRIEVQGVPPIHVVP